MGRNRRSRRTRTARNADAEEAVNHLSEVLISGLSDESTIADNAARQLIGIGKKHGIRADPSIRGMICRTCKKSMLPPTVLTSTGHKKTELKPNLRLGK